MCGYFVFSSSAIQGSAGCKHRTLAYVFSLLGISFSPRKTFFFVSFPRSVPSAPGVHRSVGDQVERSVDDEEGGLRRWLVRLTRNARFCVSRFFRPEFHINQCRLSIGARGFFVTNRRTSGEPQPSNDQLVVYPPHSLIWCASPDKLCGASEENMDWLEEDGIHEILPARIFIFACHCIFKRQTHTETVQKSTRRYNGTKYTELWGRGIDMDRTRKQTNKK